MRLFFGVNASTPRLTLDVTEQARWLSPHYEEASLTRSLVHHHIYKHTMQDPVYEITSVIKGIVQAQNATLQRETLRKFYAPDASFDHPFFLVSSSASSRETGILPIYQWQRCLYVPQVEVHNVGE